MNRNDARDDARRTEALARIQAAIELNRQQRSRSATDGVLENAMHQDMRTVRMLFKPVLQPDGSMKLQGVDQNIPVDRTQVIAVDIPVPDEFWPVRVVASVGAGDA